MHQHITFDQQAPFLREPSHFETLASLYGHTVCENQFKKKQTNVQNENKRNSRTAVKFSYFTIFCCSQTQKFCALIVEIFFLNYIDDRLTTIVLLILNLKKKKPLLRNLQQPPLKLLSPMPINQIKGNLINPNPFHGDFEFLQLITTRSPTH